MPTFTPYVKVDGVDVTTDDSGRRWFKACQIADQHLPMWHPSILEGVRSACGKAFHERFPDKCEKFTVDKSKPWHVREDAVPSYRNFVSTPAFTKPLYDMVRKNVQRNYVESQRALPYNKLTVRMDGLECSAIEIALNKDETIIVVDYMDKPWIEVRAGVLLGFPDFVRPQQVYKHMTGDLARGKLNQAAGRPALMINLLRHEELWKLAEQYPKSGKKRANVDKLMDRIRTTLENWSIAGAASAVAAPPPAEPEPTPIEKEIAEAAEEIVAAVVTEPKLVSPPWVKPDSAPVIEAAPPIAPTVEPVPSTEDRILALESQNRDILRMLREERVRNNILDQRITQLERMRSKLRRLVS